MFEPLEHTTPECDHDVLRKLARQLTQKLIYEFDYKYSGRYEPCALEVGSWVGSTALTLSPYFDRLYCVDTFQGTDRLKPIADAANSECDGVFRVFCENVKDELMNGIIPCVGKSLEWAYIWPFQVDLIFIDADHEYESVLADIQAWKPHCRGILCGHDYSQMFPGVIQAVDESFPSEQVNVEGNVWWVDLDPE